MFIDEAANKDKLLDVCNAINLSSNINETLIESISKITSAFKARRLIIYVVDNINKELVSRFKSDDEIDEIRVPIFSSSIAGFAAYKRRIVNIKNAYDEKELKLINPNLKFDKNQALKQNKFLQPLY
mmetsp:Transcript_451/g.264  ORF Transcript_451/g.264 Transcript_451/m.264 type:complete len:127 (+) Transcript_451:1120-1500(+)